jgi:formate-nitrite transporter family protein
VRGALGLGTYVHWLLMAVLGNVIGGVVLVTVLNYGQIRLARG